MKQYIKAINRKIFGENSFHKAAREKNKLEKNKKPVRTDIINFLLSVCEKQNEATTYLEIGVRNPDHNFTHIKAKTKYSVDPGVEFEKNPVDFKLTSDEFFSQLDNGEILSKDTRFDVIFIDGLHLAEQVDRDIENALNYIKEDGFIVLHDCNPPTEWHAREEYYYTLSPAEGYWNGTTWKAFVKWRQNGDLQSCCINTDWGVGIISKKQPIGNALKSGANPFYEYKVMDDNRKEHLGLKSFEELKSALQ